MNIVIEILEYFKAEQIVNKNTPFEIHTYDYAISTIINTERLCNIRGELCKIYGKKIDELEILAELDKKGNQ